MTTGRKCKRQDLRKRLLYQVTYQTVDRVEPSLEMILKLASAIIGNQSSEFGVGKLYNIKLDGFYDFSSLFDSSRQWAFGKMTLLRLACALGRDGIVAALIRAGADPNARPCICTVISNSAANSIGSNVEMSTIVHNDTNNNSYNSCILGKQLRKKLKGVVPMFSVWIVRVVVQLRLQYLLEEVSERHAMMNEVICAPCVTENEDSGSLEDAGSSMIMECCCSSNAETAFALSSCTKRFCLFRFPVCHHIICESQFWHHILSILIADGISCPVCQQSLENFELKQLLTVRRAPSGSHVPRTAGKHKEKQLKHTAIGERNHSQPEVPCLDSMNLAIGSSERVQQETSDRCNVTTLSASNDNVLTGSVTTDVKVNVNTRTMDGYIDWADQNSVAGITVNDSLSRWEALPCGLADAPEIVKKPVFRARALNEIAVLYLGYTQTARNTELFRASAAGNSRRLRALFSAGININWQDEYGHTALFLASWYGVKNSVSVLLAIGADPTIADNMGTIPLVVAKANGHNWIVEKLSKYVAREESVSATTTTTHSLCEDLERLSVQQSHSCGDENAVETSIRSACFTPLTAKDIQIVIDFNAAHPGAGTFYVDNMFSDSELELLVNIFNSLPVAEPEKSACSHRSYYCDATGSVRRLLGDVLHKVQYSIIEGGLLSGHDNMATSKKHVDVDDDLNTQTVNCGGEVNTRVTDGVKITDRSEIQYEMSTRDHENDDDDEDTDMVFGSSSGVETGMNADNSVLRICSEALPQMRFLHVCIVVIVYLLC